LTYFFTGREAKLSYHVFAIRKALGDADNGRFIETVPKRGYRFTAQVDRANRANRDLPHSRRKPGAGASLRRRCCRKHFRNLEN
jgi:DNA-binding winged helix-turn-helix (wHTH) protein